LFALIYSLRANVDRYARIYISVMKRQLTSQREHREILQACRRRDVDAAGAALEEHLRMAYTELAAYLQRERTEDAGSAEGSRR
jgi:DNA-binding GntR family transcriptional regulator